MSTSTELAAALADRYTIERELGGGGMSRVFLARERALARDVVVKVLSSDVAGGVSVERFAREIQLAASLQQANIVPLLSAGDAAGVPYFTMPYVQGESLRRRLTTGDRIPIAECIGIARDVARALSYAHQHGVVHRDIKPDNVLLSHGAAMVTDFGIAKAVSASRTTGDATTLTQVGMSIGTPSYMSPEQIAGDPDVGPPADLYAWGCLTFELLTGEPPFVRDSPQRVLAAHLADAPPSIANKRPDVPPALEALIQRCLAKDPRDRPAGAADVLKALESDITAPRPITRRRGPVIAIAAIAIALAVVVAALARGRGAGRPVSTAAASAANAVARSIAVLPLANLGGDKSDDYFGIGLAEEMTRALSKTGVRVIGRVSASALLAKGLDERAVAKELGVGSLLTGSVQHAGDQVRINVSLIDASDGAVRWTERYDRPLTNVFAVQDEIARTVATKLLGTLGGARSAASRIETADPEAYALFLQGQVLLGRRTAQTIGQAISLFERALARDSTYARAQAALAMAFTVTPSYVQGQTDANLARGRAAAQRAIALDSTIAESYTALGYADLLQHDHRAAERAFRSAIALDSTSATAWGWWALLANAQGDFPTAYRRAARARELEPASMIARVWEAQTYINSRRYAIADSLCRDAIAFDSTFALMWSTFAISRSLQGHGDEAIAILERQVAELPPRPPTATHALLALAYARAGNTAKARAALEAQRQIDGGAVPASGFNAAALAELGDRDSALVVLDRAVTQHEAWLVQYLRSAAYDKLRRDPRGAAIIAKAEHW